MNTKLDNTTRHAPRTGLPRRAAIVVATTIAMLLGLVMSAQAGTSVDRAPYQEGLFYGDFDAEVALFAGATVEDFCTGNEPVHDAVYRISHDGSLVITVAPNQSQPLYLYSTPLGSPEFLDEQCPLLNDGDSATDVQQPFAVGEGHMKLRLEIAPDGTVHIDNTSWGAVTSANGTTWQVRGRADLTVVDGVPVGSPTEFQSLQIVRTGR